MIDHLGFHVSNYAQAKAFFHAALAPLGITVVMEDGPSGMLARDGKPQFWFGEYGPPPGPIHIAFTANARAQVDAFHAAALAAGAKDNGAPGLRPHDGANGYYAAFIRDPDGNRVEAVTFTPP